MPGPRGAKEGQSTKEAEERHENLESKHELLGRMCKAMDGEKKNHEQEALTCSRAEKQHLSGAHAPSDAGQTD